MPVLVAAWRGHTGGVGGELLVGRNLTDVPHRMPYLFRVGPEYLP